MKKRTPLLSTTICTLSSVPLLRRVSSRYDLPKPDATYISISIMTRDVFKSISFNKNYLNLAWCYLQKIINDMHSFFKLATRVFSKICSDSKITKNIDASSERAYKKISVNAKKSC